VGEQVYVEVYLGVVFKTGCEKIRGLPGAEDNDGSMTSPST
jgi:hypothetical protein